MANMLFNRNKQNNTPLVQLQQLRRQGPANVLFNKMYNSNPQFKQFADSMQGKTPEQAFSEHGLDFNRFKNLKW